jgi:hypothetical protein
MAYTQGLCSKLQVNLNDVAGMNSPSLKRQKVGYVDALMSEINRSQMTAQMVPTNGKFQQVQVNWVAQACEDLVDTTCTLNCTPDIDPAPKETIISSFNCLKYKMGFDENEMRKLCEADNLWVGQNIMNAMNAINVSLEKALLAGQASNFGCDMNGVEEHDVPLFTTGGTPNAMAWAYVKHIYEEMGAMGTPLLVGGGNFDLFAKAQQIACCNAGGMDLSRMTGDAFFYHSPSASSVWGSTKFAALAPGAVQLITWNKYVGDYAKRNDSFEHGTIVDPFTGLVYDLKTNYDDCSEKWFVELSLNYHQFFVPQSSSCGQTCINGTLSFNDCSENTGITCP